MLWRQRTVLYRALCDAGIVCKFVHENFFSLDEQKVRMAAHRDIGPANFLLERDT